VVVSGPDAGKVLDIRKVENTIGRDGCDLELEDPEISRRHALVSIEGVRARLRDLHSTNGTFVAEKPIEEAMLENRDQFRVGSHQVALVVTENDEVDDDE
jgi:S-DNA-T family DNA segregation ATPase FtsK/SpoIIIE